MKNFTPAQFGQVKVNDGIDGADLLNKKNLEDTVEDGCNIFTNK